MQEVNSFIILQLCLHLRANLAKIKLGIQETN